MKPVDTNRKLPSQIKAIPLAKMRVSVNAQRELRPGRVNALLSDFDLSLPQKLSRILLIVR